MPNPNQAYEVDGQRFRSHTATFNATGSTDAMVFTGIDARIVVQLSGTATAVTAVVERSTNDPLSASANWAPAEDAVFSGNLANGIAPRQYAEPSSAYWRVRISSISGGNCTVSIAGPVGGNAQ